MIKFILLAMITVSCASVPKCHQLERIEEREVCYEREKQNQYDIQHRWRYHYPEYQR
jgi:hypothetical protein